jgi:hypothetical protein
MLGTLWAQQRAPKLCCSHQPRNTIGTKRWREVPTSPPTGPACQLQTTWVDQTPLSQPPRAMAATALQPNDSWMDDGQNKAKKRNQAKKRKGKDLARVCARSLPCPLCLLCWGNSNGAARAANETKSKEASFPDRGWGQYEIGDVRSTV